jgi:hypothetical protein
MASEETKAQDAVSTTDTAPVYRKSWSSVDVKIELDRASDHARITSKDGRVGMVLPLALIERKFRRDEELPKVSYFKARMITGVGSLEIEDRIVDVRKHW